MFEEPELLCFLILGSVSCVRVQFRKQVLCSMGSGFVYIGRTILQRNLLLTLGGTPDSRTLEIEKMGLERVWLSS